MPSSRRRRGRRPAPVAMDSDVDSVASDASSRNGTLTYATWGPGLPSASDLTPSESVRPGNCLALFRARRGRPRGPEPGVSPYSGLHSCHGIRAGTPCVGLCHVEWSSIAVSP